MLLITLVMFFTHLHWSSWGSSSYVRPSPLHPCFFLVQTRCYPQFVSSLDSLDSGCLMHFSGFRHSPFFAWQRLLVSDFQTTIPLCNPPTRFTQLGLFHSSTRIFGLLLNRALEFSCGSWRLSGYLALRSSCVFPLFLNFIGSFASRMCLPVGLFLLLALFYVFITFVYSLLGC